MVQSAVAEHAGQRASTAAHAAWGAVAPAWEGAAEAGDARVAAVTAAMLARADVRAGDRVLEAACGLGAVGLAAAALVGPDGEVVLSDVAPEMVEAAARRAAARGVHVATAVRDLEALDEPTASFDAAVCREGLQFTGDPAAAAGELARVVRPGGRVVVACWGPREDNPWIGLVFEVVGEAVGRPVPPPGAPHPLALGDEGALRRLLGGAGLDDVCVDRVDCPLEVPDAAAWWTWVTALAGPLAAVVAALPPATVAGLVERLADAGRSHRTAAGYRLPGAVLVASARRPR